ncbi:MAG: YdbL family protein [Desulfuromonadales bacterium]|nr:YdbL family protein [Desulfuromonadales bacterium]
MKTYARLLPLLSIFLIISCVTINIYFPAEEVRGAADRIVDEVWGERAQDPPPPVKGPGSSLFNLLQPSSAYAAQNIDITTPEIRAIREAMKERSASLFPFLDSGHVGVGADGLLKVRTTDGLDLKARGEANRLVKAENDDRQRLYKEIARANGFPDKVDEVRNIFAQSWRDRAAKGWYLEQPGGAWAQK